jgi:hypothetical protein
MVQTYVDYRILVPVSSWYRALFSTIRVQLGVPIKHRQVERIPVTFLSMLASGLCSNSIMTRANVDCTVRVQFARAGKSRKLISYLTYSDVLPQTQISTTVGHSQQSI